MKKSYDRNRALLRRKSAFDRMKDHYRNAKSSQRDTVPDFKELKQWRNQRDRSKRRQQVYVALIYLLLTVGTMALYRFF